MASYFFYGYWNWKFCGLLALSTVVDFYLAQFIHASNNPTTRKHFLFLSLLVNLGILSLFKYFNFFADSFVQLFNTWGFNADYVHLHIILPVGISFYTFQTLSYTIDVYRNRLNPTTNFTNFALFVAFFPQLVAGPIERARHLLPQLSRSLMPSKWQVKQGIVLIVTGLFRKVMIGDNAGRYVDHIFADLELYKSIEIIAAVVLFSVQIYADFSGYSHIARGVAKLLGIELMKNFEQPYFSKNISEFWHRWHISLSTWLKDYLYISLGGNRKGQTRTYVNLMITMLLGGLWHGAGWNFIIWGGLHGVFLVIHKLFLVGPQWTPQNTMLRFLKKTSGTIFTYLLVVVAWWFFRATSWDMNQILYSRLVTWESSQFALRFLWIVLGFLSITLLFDFAEYKSGHHTFMLHIKSKALTLGILAAMFTTTVFFMIQNKPLPFVYFQF